MIHCMCVCMCSIGDLKLLHYYCYLCSFLSKWQQGRVGKESERERECVCFLSAGSLSNRLHRMLGQYRSRRLECNHITHQGFNYFSHNIHVSAESCIRNGGFKPSNIDVGGYTQLLLNHWNKCPPQLSFIKDIFKIRETQNLKIEALQLRWFTLSLLKWCCTYERWKLLWFIFILCCCYIAVSPSFLLDEYCHTDMFLLNNNDNKKLSVITLIWSQMMNFQFEIKSKDIFKLYTVI